MKVAIGTSSFGEADPSPLELLREHDVELVPNPLGRRLTEAELPAHIGDCDGLIAGLEPLTRAVLTAAPQLKAIARVGVGLDTVDLKAASELGIRVSITAAAPAPAVAEMAVGAMIMLSRSVPTANAALHEGRWERVIGRNLSESVVLVVGFGRIGHRVVELLAPFGAEILVHDPFVDQLGSARGTFVSLEEGLQAADIVTLHAIGNSPILDATAFTHLRPGALVLNSGRGGLIDEEALAAALDTGIVAGAWLDVFRTEPYEGPLTGYPQVILTPHMATHTRQTRARMELEAVENLLRDLAATAR